MTTMSNSSLVNYTKLSPNNSGKRTQAITRITPHCVVGQCSVETLGNIFYSSSRQCSCNYGIGSDGRVGLYCDEGNRSWCSSSNYNDQRAVTIECASDASEPYAFKDVVYSKLVDLCVDICKRNGKKVLLWLGDKSKTDSYEKSMKSDEMLLSVHRWYATYKTCPGTWMFNRMGQLAADVTEKLNPTTVKTEKTADDLIRVQCGAFTVKENAENYQNKIKKAGFDAFIKQEGKYYKVQVGAFKSLTNAQNYLSKVKAAGFDAFLVGGTEDKTETTAVKGDVDGDGVVSVADARQILRYATKLDTPTEAQKKIADIDGDGEVDVEDARLALRLAVGLDK
jgi:hypothetical protein